MSLRPIPRKTRNQVNKTSSITKENIYNPVLLQDKNNKAKINEKEVDKNPKKRKVDLEVLSDIRLTRKRAAFGDITNAFEKQFDKKEKPKVNKALNAKCSNPLGQLLVKSVALEKLPKEKTECSIINAKSKPGAESDFLNESIIVLSQKFNLASKTPDDGSSYLTASEGSILQDEEPPTPAPKDQDSDNVPKLPPGVEDFDKITISDIHAVPLYAMDIFNYYKTREAQFHVPKYISQQPDVTRTMRAILVDWMVEVQESFELNHETLYLAVKLVDLYLSKVVIKRDRLQLVGSTGIFIACKFDERSPPYVDDFLYICDDAYTRKELLAMEIKMLKTLNYDLGMPLSYRFLRRYARCNKVDMGTLTFARYILEMSLMDYEFIEASGSLLAAAALFLALRIKEYIKEWSATLTYYSGYSLSDFSPLAHLLHQMLLQPPKEHLQTIRNKYCHKVFFEVAHIPIPPKIDA